MIRLIMREFQESTITPNRELYFEVSWCIMIKNETFF